MKTAIQLAGFSKADIKVVNFEDLKRGHGTDHESQVMLRSNSLRTGDLLYFGNNPKAIENKVNINGADRIVNSIAAYRFRNGIYAIVLVPISTFQRAGFDSPIVEIFGDITDENFQYPTPRNAVNPDFVGLGTLDLADTLKGKCIEVVDTVSYIAGVFSNDGKRALYKKPVVLANGATEERLYLTTRAQYAPKFTSGLDLVKQTPYKVTVPNETEKLTASVVDAIIEKGLTKED